MINPQKIKGIRRKRKKNREAEIQEEKGNAHRNKVEDQHKKNDEKDIYNELKSLIVKLPSIWNLLNVLTERGTNISKTLIQTLASVIREEVRLFLRSINVIELTKSVLSDTAIELKIEITFKDKKRSSKKESSS